ncbi:MAG: hypothetical protein ACI9FB_003330 [Candidatus Azotimanducaceae bacterium]|jgi:hypothetical protein
MLKSFSPFLLFALLTFSCNTPIVAKSVVIDNVDKLNTVKESIEAHIKKNTEKNAESILVIFDIDDTLLKSDSFVGGDTWYNWQRGKTLKSTAEGEVTIDDSDKVACLFSKLGVLYELGTYHATETDAVDIVGDLAKFDLMALTSRSPDYRGGTERELTRAGFDFDGAHLLAKSEALAYTLFDGKNTRPVTYQNGIVMSTGLNKGAVLIDLLKKIDKEYASIFFVDDSRKNITDMEKAWRDSSSDMNIFHYTGVDKRISPEDVLQAKDSREALNAFIQSAFPSRASSFSDGSCQ